MFELFKPEAESPKEFYAELPIAIRVKGSYHQFGNFVSGTAALPRIVTLHNFNISSPKKGETAMTMEATAKTYRYLEQSEIKRPEKSTKGKKKGKKKAKKGKK